MWQALFGNLAIVALFISGWVHLQQAIEGLSRPMRALATGAVMGCGAIASMLMAFRLDGGVLIDLRTTLVALASIFGGPLAAVVSVAIAGVYRAVIGGPTAVSGVLSISLVAVTGLAGYYLFGRGGPNVLQAFIVTSATAVVPLLSALAASSTISAEGLTNLALPVMLLKIAVTFGAACLMRQGMQLERERSVLRSAVAHAPDFFYVKDLKSAFVAANHRVAEFHGLADPAALVGKTDFELTEPERARSLFEAEQRVMATGDSIAGIEEELVDHAGLRRWFATSKAPIANRDGDIVGLAGVTRDITDRKRLEHDLTESRNQLSYVLAEMSDGLALFDADGTLVFCNERYRACFPLTAEIRRPGAHLADILRAVVRTGEQRGIPADAEGWVARIAGAVHDESDQELHLSDGRWMQVRTRPTSDGRSVVLVSEVTRTKDAELAMHGLTEQLRLLASTDSLTGLPNRRAFDEALEREISRSQRDLSPLSLLLIDVDRFKAFNDIYGHQAGDTCLKAVSRCIISGLRRPADLAARYGGEEFVVILPDTDDDGAFTVAQNLRTALRAEMLPHEGSEKKVVTVSVGIACYDTRQVRRSAAELIQRADEAMYTAKTAGRDRAVGWRERHPVALPRASA